MKRIGKRLLPLLALLLTLTGCGHPSVIDGGNCYPDYAVRIDGQLYHLENQETTLTQIEVLGRITSCVASDRTPKADDQSNTPVCVNKPYGTSDGQLYVYYIRNWHLCTPIEDTASHDGHDAQPGTYEPYTFILNTGGEIYYCRDEVADVRGVEVQGRITSYLPSEYPPTVGHQSTVPECVGGEYGTLNGRLYLYYSCLWHPCYRPSELNISN